MKKLFLLLLLIGMIGCKDDSLNDIVASLFLPNLSNQWTSSRDTKFFFNPTKNNVNESTFLGSEQGNQGIDELSGSFKDYLVEFTFTSGDEQGVTYKGNFIKDSKPLTMVVKNKDGDKITITQN